MRLAHEQYVRLWKREHLLYLTNWLINRQQLAGVDVYSLVYMGAV